MVAKIPVMGKSKSQTDSRREPRADRHKPSRSVRIPDKLATPLEELAEEEYNNLTAQVIAAIREYLGKRDRLPQSRPKNA